MTSARASLFRLAVRATNFGGRVGAVFGARPSLEPRVLRARAVRRTRLEDFGDRGYEEGLTRLCESAERDARLSPIGRFVFGGFIVSALVTRLRLRQRIKETPELFDAPLVPPFVILGLPRSGTTFLHRLLSAAPNARALVYWELREPISSPEDDRRVRDAQRDVSRLLDLQPGIQAKHAFGAHEPEECVMLFDSSLWAPTAWRLAPVYGYLDWLLESDPRPGYREYRRHLQLFQARTPGARLVLKNPDHTGFLATLLEVIPEAMVIQTHRDPVTTLASYNSLMTSMHGCFTEPDRARSGRWSAKWWTEAVQRNLEHREHLASDRVYDLDYETLVSDPLEAVRGIYGHFGLSFDSEVERRVRAAIDARPRHAFGKHEYDLADDGLDAAEVREAFAHYIGRFVATR